MFATKYQVKRVTAAILNCVSFHSLYNPIQSTFIPDNKVHNTYYSYSNKSKEKWTMYNRERQERIKPVNTHDTPINSVKHVQSGVRHSCTS